MAPGLRIFFHDCFVNGCDASLLLNGSSSEKTASSNLPLRGFQVIKAVKAQLERACPGVVSCADIFSFAARDSVVLGRDGLVSQASNTANLPAFDDPISVQIRKFSDKGLNTQDLVTLVGGRTIRTAACLVFSYRLYNFNNTNQPDPTINQVFLPQLRALCPNGGNGNIRVGLDRGSVNRFDKSFYKNLRNGRGVLESDAKLLSNPTTQSGKKVNVRILFTPEGNGIDVIVLVESICAISKQFANTAYGFFLGKKVAYPVVANYVRNTWDAMLENGPWFIRNNPFILKKWHPDENLLKEDGRSSYSRVMIELRADVKLKDNIVVAMPKITRRAIINVMSVLSVSENLLGVRLKEYRPILKKSTVSSSGHKKKGVEPTIEVSNLNPFGVLNSINNDVEFGKLRLLDNDENPQAPTGIVKSDSEVEVVFDETANLRILTSGKDGSDKGYGINSLLEQ
uniref:peroxidase n=1 Tax=Tanacetum cinerariifolium TaxID=118510 RepID=A0A6L2MSS8_TANCI|nr:peroxidase N1-like [Tanacetum cinerariifolium]